MRNVKTGLSVFAVVCSAALPAWADVAYETVEWGGDGGQEFDSECGSGFVKGLALRSQTLIDRVGLRCVDPRSGNIESINTQYGGSGGYARTTTCKTGYVVKGLRGRSHTYVDRLQLTCVEEADVAKANDGANETIDSNYPIFGGDGGDYFSVRCGGGDAAVGIHGSAANLVDRIGLWCKSTGN
jgi:hypothetical protein